ncbi:DNA-directed RNA polymerase I subunit RPA1-like [Centruroides sculpturatus]|uniref:DNA-directed RNA polymerase I subunit RPA1-like n=1 Tax=Centruroides sculpturatus TaxID=218467 RepID=UPI000C6DA205|nr:DNA-directed RNA polymerase I subunit RPA1-like [Centruroides sculpturatus]
MDFQEIPHRFLKGITFGIYSSEELRKFSVIEITSIKTFDALGHPAANGLHDPALGPSEFNELCKTCGLSQFHCPGHFGHINLPLPVFNPFLLTILHKLLRGSCFNCHSLLASPIAVQLTLAQLRVLDYGLVGVAQEMQQMVAEFQEKESMSNILYIKDKLANHVNKALEGLDLEEAKKCSSVKNVVECRQRIVKNFIRDHLQKSGNKCYYCRTVQRPLSLYFFSCLVFKEKKAKSSKPLPSQSVEEECDDQERNENENISKLISSTNQSLLTAVEARDHLRKLWDKERTILQKLFGISNLAIDSHECPLDMFFLENVMVPPTRFRPISFMKGKKFENPQTAALKNVIHSSIVVRELLKSKKEGINLASAKDDALKSVLATVPGSNVTEKLHSARITLQLKVNAVTDTEMDKLSKEKYPGMKQILEKKEGLFRKHMMGKRVDYAARSVISPDPYIMSDEVGIPMVFATKLTYPQPVTPWNIRELRQAVINGPNVYPGAVLVKKEDGSVVKLSPTNHIQREAIAKKLLTPSHFNKKSQGNKIVYRHLQSGDILLLNRQPTLHKPSIMGHRVRVLPGEKTLRLHYANCKCYNADFDGEPTLHKPSIMGHRVRVLPGEKTLRLHYANCKCYNADFDGDEMNVHFPQSELARSEAYNIASVNYQYLVPKDGTPLSGLIQDHVVSGSLLSMRGTFFTREDYQELVFGALTFIQRPLKLLPPCIIKPKALWSGKQIISTVIINIIPLGKPPPTIEGSAKIAAKNWQNKTNQRYSIPLIESMSESTVIIRSGELLCGVLDKAHYGPTPYGLVHCCYELYGGQTSTLLLTSLARLFTHYLQIHIGFTLGIEDITVTSKANKKRWKIMKSAKKVGDKTIAEALDVTDYTNKSEIISKYQDAHLSKNDLGRKQIDAAMKTETDTFNNEINKICIPDGLWKKFPQNNLQLMIQSGAKGSSVNAMQISCLLGQIELEGKRVPLMISGKSLPSFLPYDTTPRAGGFVDGRFLTGIRPQEYFFHCMAGREDVLKGIINEIIIEDFRAYCGPRTLN